MIFKDILVELQRLNLMLEMQKAWGERQYGQLKETNELLSGIVNRLQAVRTDVSTIRATDKVASDHCCAVSMRMAQHGELLQQMADDLTCMEAELAAIRGSMAERETQPAAEPEDTKPTAEQRAQDRLLDGLNNLMTYMPKAGGMDKED